ncbi:MAG TPA: PDZ domain-containing protein [Polyangiaceae bacterium]|nr:PDZ domain-containing protein [Polyangiaceae bacterium]
MGYLFGALGYAMVVLVLGGAAHGGARLGSRWLTHKRFRWFDAAPPASSLARSTLVRTFSVFAALLVAFGLQVIGLLVSGHAEPTLSVEVIPGPAKRAGLQSGDRIVSVDGKKLTSFEELRGEIQRRPGERRLELDRGGQPLTLLVTPEDGRIGVMPRYRQLSISLPAALEGAAGAISKYPRTILKSAFSPSERTELAGPVAIVNSVGGQSNGGSRALVLAMIAGVFWPIALGVHLFDALTLTLFRATHGWAASAEVDIARHARIFQTLLVSCLCALGYVVLAAIQEGADFGNGALPGLIVLGPAAISAVLLVGIAARLRFGVGVAIGFVLACVTIPCAVIVLSGVALHWQRLELRRRGYAVSWFVTLPPSAGPSQGVL